MLIDILLRFQNNQPAKSGYFRKFNSQRILKPRTQRFVILPVLIQHKVHYNHILKMSVQRNYICTLNNPIICCFPICAWKKMDSHNLPNSPSKERLDFSPWTSLGSLQQLPIKWFIPRFIAGCCSCHFLPCPSSWGIVRWWVVRYIVENHIYT